MKKTKRICIFCSSSNYIDSIFFSQANKLASLFACKNYELVFGGGTIGLMGEIARVFKINKKKVISVIPKKLNKKGIVFEDSDEIIETRTMQERKSIMTDISDAFIALPGGFGTLEEILEIITLKQLGFHKKRIAILNTDNFYDNLLMQIDLLINKKFAYKKNKSIFFISESPEEIFRYIEKND